jgi:hypothetical protein
VFANGGPTSTTDRRTMTPIQHDHPRSHFVEARARAERERTDQRERAVRTVAGQARDRTEFTALLSMLGLDGPAHRPVPLSRRLATYVHEVAAAVGVPAESVACEVTDTATSYLGLDWQWPTRADRDLMLVWDERLGWYIAVETDPTEAPVVIAYLVGDRVPSPAAVARFVAGAAAGGGVTRIRPVLPMIDRVELAEKMAAVCQGTQ